ncbi:hypothetical protein OHB44_33240 (plasmid) [Micromonospora sp. NBC_00821]|uniref:hypothetical protein n=1 Tax=Micromonospora sp. NBC_00821 TaxID=2975977 RepID=UPI002ED3DB4D|nr:hypothetical protein OHB44_33240 [Micromonospora sp. NBC_00821]
MTSQPASEFHQPERYFAALGRVMHALALIGVLGEMTALRWWSADQTWKIEWRTGPDPHQVAAMLWQAAADLQHPASRALRGMTSLDRSNGSPHYAYLQVLDVPVMLRALDPAASDTRLAAASV